MEKEPRNGFKLVKEKGAIRYYSKPGIDRLIRIDYHGAKEVPTGTCQAILRAAGLRRRGAERDRPEVFARHRGHGGPGLLRVLFAGPRRVHWHGLLHRGLSVPGARRHGGACRAAQRTRLAHPADQSESDVTIKNE